MLSIEPSKHAESALRYFRESLCVGDYYSENQSITGQWHGRAAQQLGLYGDVASSDFEKLLNNINPSTDRRLTARNSKNRRPMYDFTFNAPKSVSLLHALTGDKDILAAHRRAVLSSMAEIESDMQTQAGSGKEKHYVTTGNALWAEFIHTTSRPVKQTETQKYAPDPHLHTHCALINATFCKQQNRFKAVELGNIKGQGHYYEALYHAHLAQQLKASGYGLMRAGKRWEIQGIDRALVEKFSGRTLEIEDFAKAKGITSLKAKAQLGRKTRKAKSRSMEDGLLHNFWMSLLTDEEHRAVFSAKKNTAARSGRAEAPLSIKRLFKGVAQKTEANPMQKITAKRLIDLALRHCFARNSALAEKKLLAFALDQSLGDVSPSSIKDDLAGRNNILSKIHRGIKYITTKEMNAEEEWLIDQSNAAKNKRVPFYEHYTIKDKRLNAGQSAAVQHVLTSRDNIMIVSGDAGVGKTTLLREVKTAIEDKGHQLFAFAPSSDASRNVLRSKGFERADTIAKLLASDALQEQLQDQVMLIDEAGMIGVPTMNRLLEIATAKNARVILSGDWKQHSSVERGDALKIMETACKLPIARVTEIMRQRAATLYKDIIRRIARAIGCKHDPQKRQRALYQSFDALDEAGNIVTIDDRAERHQALAKDYLNCTAASHDDVIVVAPTHAEGDALTRSIRSALQEKQRLQADEHTVLRLHNKHLTCAQKEFAQSYCMGDVVEFHQNATGFQAGRRYRVIGWDKAGHVLVEDEAGQSKPLLPDVTAHCSVYEEQQIKIAVGERIRITKNLKSLEGQALSNGQLYSVTGFSDEGHIMLSNGATLHKNSGHLHHGYVSTSYAAQGRDAQTVLLAQSSLSFGASDDKQFYVSISRGTTACRIYTDDKEELRRAVGQNGDRLTAREIAQEKEKYEAAIEEEESQWLDFRDWLLECYEGIKHIFNAKVDDYGSQAPQYHSEQNMECTGECEQGSEWQPA